MTSTVLVVGATGMVGSHVVRALRERGEPVRGFVRDRARAATVLEPDIATSVGDIADGESLRAALTGVDRALLCLSNGPHQADLEAAAIDAFADAGLRRVVKISAHGAELNSTVPFWDQHARIEAHLERSGVPSVILRPTTYASNLLGAAASVVAAGTLFAPGGTAPIGFVDPRDVAAVAAAALVADTAPDGVQTVTGPEALTFEDVAARWSSVLGRPVSYVNVPDAAAKGAMLEAGMGEWIADGIVAVHRELRSGVAAFTTDTVRTMTGREPRTVTDFLSDFAGAFAR